MSSNNISIFADTKRVANTYKFLVNVFVVYKPNTLNMCSCNLGYMESVMILKWTKMMYKFYLNPTL